MVAVQVVDRAVDLVAGQVTVMVLEVVQVMVVAGAEAPAMVVLDDSFHSMDFSNHLYMAT